MNLYSLKEISDKHVWNELLLQFEDANLYQLWDYAKIVQGEKNVRYIAIYDNDIIKGLAQVRIKSIPVIKRGIAYIFNGPVWKSKLTQSENLTLVNILTALRNEFVIKQKLVLRINPNVFENDKTYLNLNLTSYVKKRLPYNHKTIFFNLDGDLDELKSRLKQKWRKTLNRAERNELEVISGTTKDFYEDFLKLYDQMLERKKFKAAISPIPLGAFNEQLDERFKVRIFISKKDGVSVSALIASALGTTGIALFSATNEIGMKLNASNLLHWERIKWFKEVGCKCYDLGGVDPDTNKSVYEFKLGISQEEYAHVGIFEASESILSKSIVYFGEYVKKILDKYK